MLIQPYTVQWKQDFLDIKNVLDQTLLGLKYEIEHVGSTSVPNLASKPIIDIDIIYKGSYVFEKIKEALQNVEYYHNGDQGIPDREVFKRNESAQHTILDHITHHLYVCELSGKELSRHLLFRDYLRENETTRTEYQNIKYAIAHEAHQDKKTYALLKESKANSFIESIVTKARSLKKTL